MSIFTDILQTSQISLELKATTKEAAIHELVDLMASGGGITDALAVEGNILERERGMSTGLHDGVAIPHCKTDHVTTVVMAVGIKREGMDFGSMDGKPARIFVALASPTSATSQHIEVMSEVSRLLREEPVRDAVLAADSVAAVAAIFSGNASAADS